MSMLSGAAQANDSVAELGTGGIALARSDVISMDSEDLYISRDAVEVTYFFGPEGVRVAGSSEKNRAGHYIMWDERLARA